MCATTPSLSRRACGSRRRETGYRMVADHGIVDGKLWAERPQAISTDGRRRPLHLNGRPIPGVPPGAVAFGSRSDSQTLEIGAEVDGKVFGAGTNKVSADEYVDRHQ